MKSCHPAIRFLRDEEAASSTEYALLAVLIALGSFLAMQNLGQALNSLIGNPILLAAIGGS